MKITLSIIVWNIQKYCFAVVSISELFILNIFTENVRFAVCPMKAQLYWNNRSEQMIIVLSAFKSIGLQFYRKIQNFHCNIPTKQRF